MIFSKSKKQTSGLIVEAPDGKEERKPSDQDYKNYDEMFIISHQKTTIRLLIVIGRGLSIVKSSIL